MFTGMSLQTLVALGDPSPDSPPPPLQGARRPPFAVIGQRAAALLLGYHVHLPPPPCADTLLPAELNQSHNVHTATVTYADS